MTTDSAQEYFKPLLDHACASVLRDEWCHGESESVKDSSPISVFMHAGSVVRSLEGTDIAKYNALRELVSKAVADFEGPRGIRFRISGWFPHSFEELSCATAYHTWILRTHMPVPEKCKVPSVHRNASWASADVIR